MSLACALEVKKGGREDEDPTWKTQNLKIPKFVPFWELGGILGRFAAMHRGKTGAMQADPDDMGNCRS